MDPTRVALRTARVIAGALPAGVLVFWTVGWVLTDGGRTGVAPEAIGAEPALWLWSAAALAGFAGALLCRGRALQATEGAAGEPAPARALGQVQAYLVIAWALLEAPALLGGVFLLLRAARSILWAAAAVYAIGIVVTFPRAEWFNAAGDEGPRGD